MRIATVAALAALPLGLALVHAAGAAVTSTVVAAPVRSSYETATRMVSRDVGLSVALPDGHDLWVFGDTGTWQKVGRAWVLTGFVDGSTALLARYAKGQVPHGREVPAAKPARFVPVPTKVYLPDRSGRLCVKPNPTAAYSARWPTGAAVMSTNNARVLVTYTVVCVTTPKRDTVAQRAEGWGYMLYNWRTHRIDRGPIDVFAPHVNGATLPAAKNFGWPVFSNGKLTLFSSSCTQLYVSCARGHVYSVTMAPTIPALDKPSSYKINELFTDGSSQWEPLSISVGRYAGGLRLLEQTSIGAAYKIFSAAGPGSRWHLLSQGTLPGCVSKTAFCYALAGHPELSVTGSMFVSYMDPNSGPGGGHVVVSALPG